MISACGSGPLASSTSPSVSIAPGETALTVMPCSPSVRASERVRPIRAALLDT
jgi:hypothetical protein